jgi:hypothetical protein
MDKRRGHGLLLTTFGIGPCFSSDEDHVATKRLTVSSFVRCDMERIHLYYLRAKEQVSANAPRKTPDQRQSGLLEVHPRTMLEPHANTSMRRSLVYLRVAHQCCDQKRRRKLFRETRVHSSNQRTIARSPWLAALTAVFLSYTLMNTSHELKAGDHGVYSSCRSYRARAIVLSNLALINSTTCARAQGAPTRSFSQRTLKHKPMLAK